MLRPFRSGEVSVAEVGEIFETIGGVFADDGLDFEAVEDRGYLRAGSPIATADCSAESAAGRLPDEFMPTGDGAATFHRLQSELQMLLHDHPVNRRRRERGMPAVNTLWLWGGGHAGAADASVLPRLVSDDPLFRGYWSSRGQPASPWTPDASDAAVVPGRDAVITVPERLVADDLRDFLARLRSLLRTGRAGKLTLFFAGDVVARISRRDGMKFWRGLSPLLGEPGADG